MHDAKQFFGEAIPEQIMSPSLSRTLVSLSLITLHVTAPPPDVFDFSRESTGASDTTRKTRIIENVSELQRELESVGKRPPIDEELKQIRKGLTADEVIEYRKQAGFYRQPPIALFIFGPSASGKSYAVNHKVSEVTNKQIKIVHEEWTESGELIQRSYDAVTIDGDDVRKSSSSLQQFTRQLILDKEDLVFDPLYDKYVKPWSSKMKEELLQDSIAAGKNLIIPDVISSMDKLDRVMTELRRHAYRVYVMVVFAEFTKTCTMGVLRSAKSGKAYSGAGYLNSLRNAQRALKEYAGYLSGHKIYKNLYIGNTPDGYLKIDDDEFEREINQQRKGWLEAEGKCEGSKNDLMVKAALRRPSFNIFQNNVQKPDYKFEVIYHSGSFSI